MSRTPQGGLRLDAAITRVGVLTYRDTTGKSWTEYKPADEVFKADSLATLEGAPVTELHPEKMVDGETWKSVAVGHLVGAPRRDGDFVVAPIAVQDTSVAARCESHELHDVSAGYTCRVDWTAGLTPEGERYDAVQRDIVYNHAALGPEGWGRAGTEVSLRMDGAAEEVRSVAPGSPMKKKLKVRGREIKLDAEEDVDVAQGAVDTLSSALDAAESALKTAIGEVAALRAKTEATAAAEPPKVTEDMVTEEVKDSIATKRLALWTEARTVLGEGEKFDGKSAVEIKRLVISKTLPSTRLDGLSGDAIEGMYRACVLGAGTSATSRADSLRAAHPGAPVERSDASDDEEDADPRTSLNARTSGRFDTRGAAAERA